MIKVTARNIPDKKRASDNVPFCKPLRSPINPEMNHIRIKMLSSVENNNSRLSIEMPLADKKASPLCVLFNIGVMGF